MPEGTPMHPPTPSLVALSTRKARTVLAQPVGHPAWQAARAYAVQRAEVLAPLMADMPALLPEEYARLLVALPPALTPQAMKA
jgi:hypothetical protein